MSARVKWRHIFHIWLNICTDIVVDAIEIMYQISGLGDANDYCECRKSCFNHITSLFFASIVFNTAMETFNLIVG